MIEVFEFISRDDVFVYPLPYMIENLKNITINENIEKIRKKLRAYEILRTLDVTELQKNKTIRSTLSNKSLDKRTQKLIAMMFKKSKNKKVKSALSFRFLLMYCQLLKMIIIQLTDSKRPAKQKLMDYLEFCHNDLKTFSFREISVAKKYFNEGHGFQFFNKIHKGRDRLFNDIDGMAWDLYHVRQLEENMVSASKSQVRYFFPAILTFDKGLNAVLDLYPLKSIAFNRSLTKTIPFYDGNFIDFLADGDQDIVKSLEFYFQREQVLWRENGRDSAKSEVAKIVQLLEHDLELIAGVKKAEDLSSWYSSAS